jgi:hypothetical protein
MGGKTVPSTTIRTIGMCESAATYSWQLGTLCGLVFAMTLLLAIASAPRLRERHEQLQPAGRYRSWLLRTCPVLCIGTWVAGAWFLGAARLSCYASYSAAAASLVLGLVVLPVIATAANHIARRSLW